MHLREREREIEMRVLLFGVITMCHWVMGPDNPVTHCYIPEELNSQLLHCTKHRTHKDRRYFAGININ